MLGYEGDELLGHNCRFLQGLDTDHITVVEICNGVGCGRRFNVYVEGGGSCMCE
jgi:hypothetical protein